MLEGPIFPVHHSQTDTVSKKYQSSWGQIYSYIGYKRIFADFGLFSNVPVQRFKIQ